MWARVHVIVRVRISPDGTAVVAIQKHWKGWVVRRRMQRMTDAALKIQKVVRGMLTRRVYVPRLRKAVEMLQAFFRYRPDQRRYDAQIRGFRGLQR